MNSLSSALEEVVTFQRPDPHSFFSSLPLALTQLPPQVGRLAWFTRVTRPVGHAAAAVIHHTGEWLRRPLQPTATAAPDGVQPAWERWIQLSLPLLLHVPPLPSLLLPSSATPHM